MPFDRFAAGGRKYTFLVGLAALGLSLVASSARADEAPSPLDAEFSLTLGTYLVEADTRMRVDGNSGRGTPIDWERTFGDGSLTRFRFDGQWRFAERHKLRAMWFSTSRSETRTIDREIDWGDETFPVNTRVKGDASYDIYQLAYEYAFLRREDWELSASIGAYYASWDASLSATITNPDGSTQRQARGDASVDAPLPVLGLRALWALPWDLSLDVSGQYFALSLDEYSGNLQDYRATLTWQPRTWFGLGVGYDWFQAHGDVDSSDFRGNLDWTFQGPMVYYSVAF